METAIILSLQLIAAILENLKAAHANPETLPDMISKVTAAKAALVTESAGFAADDAEAEANLKLRLGKTP